MYIQTIQLLDIFPSKRNIWRINPAVIELVLDYVFSSAVTNNGPNHLPIAIAIASVGNVANRLAMPPLRTKPFNISKILRCQNVCHLQLDILAS